MVGEEVDSAPGAKSTRSFSSCAAMTTGLERIWALVEEAHSSNTSSCSWPKPKTQRQRREAPLAQTCFKSLSRPLSRAWQHLHLLGLCAREPVPPPVCDAAGAVEALPLGAKAVKGVGAVPESSANPGGGVEM